MLPKFDMKVAEVRQDMEKANEEVWYLKKEHKTDSSP